MSVLIHESAISPESALWSKPSDTGDVLIWSALNTYNMTAPNVFQNTGSVTVPIMRGLYEIQVTLNFLNTVAITNIFSAYVKEQTLGGNSAIVSCPSTSAVGNSMASQTLLIDSQTSGGSYVFQCFGQCTNTSSLVSVVPLIKVTFYSR